MDLGLVSVNNFRDFWDVRAVSSSLVVVPTVIRAGVQWLRVENTKGGGGRCGL